MTEWKLKRFWTAASAEEAGDGFRVVLDSRPVKTPAKQPLVVPTPQLADAIAAEWNAQSEEIKPAEMPLTRLTNSVIDKVMKQHAEVAAMLAEYGGSDLLCYRAEGPEALIARQAESWDELLHWAERTHSIPLVQQAGVMPVAQPEHSVARMHDMTAALDAFQLTALHELVTLSGSWVIGYAALEGAFSPEELWDRALVDEYYQEEQWGKDDDAVQARAVKRAAFLTGRRYAELSRQS